MPEAYDTESPDPADHPPDTQPAQEPEQPPAHEVAQEPTESKAGADQRQDAAAKPDEETITGLRDALITHRNEAKRLRDENSQIRQWIQQVAPDLQYLKDHPEARKSQGAGTKPSSPPSEATELAQLIDLYGADAKPDSERAAKLLNLFNRVAAESAKSVVEPYATDTSQRASDVNFQRALLMKDKLGRSPDPETLKMLWKQMHPSQTANEGVAAAVGLFAIGYDGMYGEQAPQPPAKEPIVSERPGSRSGRKANLSDLDLKFASQRGRSPADWQKHVDAYQPNADGIAQLEED